MPETPPARSPSARLLLARALHLTDAMLLAAMAYRLRLAWLAASELRSAGVAQPWDAGPTLAFRPAGGDVLLAWLAGLVLLAWLAAIDKLPDSLAWVLRGRGPGTRCGNRLRLRPCQGILRPLARRRGKARHRR